MRVLDPHRQHSGLLALHWLLVTLTLLSEGVRQLVARNAARRSAGTELLWDDGEPEDEPPAR